VADFYRSAAKLVIEVDGSDHGTPERIERDGVRDRYMQKLGHSIVMLTSAKVMADADDSADGVMQSALSLIAEDRERGLARPPPRREIAAVPLPRKRTGED